MLSYMTAYSCFMPIESFIRASNQINIYFQEDKNLAYTIKDIQEIFYQNRDKWKIAAYRNYKDFIKHLTKTKLLKLEKQIHQHTSSEKQILRKKEATNFDVGLAIKKDGYLCNYSAIQFHQISTQLPKTIYVSEDKYKGFYLPNIHFEKKELLQKNIDAAFSKPQRTSSNIYKSKFNHYTYTFLQKKYFSINIGVTRYGRYNVTDLERTLIDIAVRPAYSGGVFNVLDCYINAKERVDTKKMLAHLNELNYIYPYHQLIGFYLEKAGYLKCDYEAFLEKKSSLNFYLTYNLSNKKLNRKWSIYYPMGF